MHLRLFFPSLPRVAGLWLALAAASVAAADDKTPPTEIIYPRTPAAEKSAALPGPPTAAAGSTLVFLAVAALATGGFLLWRQRQAPAGLTSREARKLAVTESRSLGNRQYLVVASYEDKKFLLGVTPGRIEMLTPLAASADDEDARA